MPNTLPIEFIRDLFATLSETDAAAIDDDDFAGFPAQCQLSTAFGVSRGQEDIAQIVDTAWPYPAGTQGVDAIVVIRGSSIQLTHYKAIQCALRHKLHDKSTLLVNFSKNRTLPSGAVSIAFLALAPGQAAEVA